MMNYENPKIPEGINVTNEHPLKDFFAMLLAVAGFIVAVFVIIFVLAEWFVRFIPFETEVKLAQSRLFDSIIPNEESDSQTLSYLKTLTQRLAKEQKLPEGMVVTVHYVDKDTVNAYATLGGHIIIFRGLLEKLPNENALAMVLAHEIAHIKHRDPIIAMGRGITIGLALTSLAGLGDGAVAQNLVGQINFLTAMAFSRDQEQDADDEALKTLLAYYGHTRGAEKLFEVLKKNQKFEPPEFLNSHPVSDERIKNIKTFQEEFVGRETEQLTPLPLFIQWGDEGVKIKTPAK